MKKIFVYFCVIGLCSCGIPLRILFQPPGFTYKYDGIYTGLDTIIDIGGYYASPEKNPDFSRDGKYSPTLMFYTDGLFCITSGTPQEVFPKDARYNPHWGVYTVSGDTIKGQCLDKSDPTSVIITYDIEIKIISKNKLSVILDGNHKNTESAIRRSLYELEFYPLESRRDSTNWLLQKKWFYKDK